MPESVQGFKKFESFCKIRPKRVRVEAKNGASIHEVVLENLHESQRFPNGFFGSLVLSATIVLGDDEPGRTVMYYLRHLGICS